jgi:hypothetical protein
MRSAFEARPKRQLQQVLQDPRFQGRLALRDYGERDLARGFCDLLQQAEAVSTLVRKQLED